MLRKDWNKLINQLGATAMVYGATGIHGVEIVTKESIAFHQARLAMVRALEMHNVIEDEEDLFFMEPEREHEDEQDPNHWPTHDRHMDADELYAHPYGCGCPLCSGTRGEQD